MAADGLISEGDHLVLDVNGEKLSFVQKLKTNGKIRVGKYMVPAAPLIGAPYGAMFEVTTDGRSLQRVLLPPADEITRITETEKNNSDLFDRNTANQKLTQEQIEQLKKSGKAGVEIIEALCSNSSTFQNKTEFSQDKYKKRKAKKYLTYLTVRRPCTRILCEAYYDKAPERVANLRHDSLAVMMSSANVAAGAKVLVAEQVAGVLTAAAVERLGGLGVVCAMQVDERPAPLDAVRQMNLSVAQRSVLFTAPAGSLLRDQMAAAKRLLCKHAAAASTGDKVIYGKQQEEPSVVTQQQPSEEEGDKSQEQEPHLPSEDVASATASAKQAGALGDMDVDALASNVVETLPPAVLATSSTGCQMEAAAVDREMEAAGGGGGGVETAGSSGDKSGRRQQQQGGGGGGGYGSFLPRPEQLRAVLTTGFDSCLVALPRVHPTALLAAIWPLLAPSATFAVFSPGPQPLAETLTHLQVSRNAVLLQLQESWLRSYQVLPARTHPHMSCAGTGGYVLSGIKIIPPDSTPLELQLQYLYGQPQLPLPLSGAPGQQQEEGAQEQTGVGSGVGAGQVDDVAGQMGGQPREEQAQEADDEVDGHRQTGEGGQRRDDGGSGSRGRGREWGSEGRNGDKGRCRGRGGWGRGRDRRGGKRGAEGSAGGSPDAKRLAM